MTAVATNVFSAFCEAGLWPGVGPALVGTLRDADIDAAERVTESALAALPGVTEKRAAKLYSAWIGAGHIFELAELLLPEGIPVRWVRRLVDELGAGAAAVLRADPWQLLVLADAQVAQVDRFARTLLPEVGPRDDRRLAALVRRVLTMEARQGHTTMSVDELAGALGQFDHLDSRVVGAAVAAAVRADVACEVEMWPEAGRVARSRADVRAEAGAEFSTESGWDSRGERLAGVALRVLAQAEADIALGLRRLQRSARPWPTGDLLDAYGSGLDEAQRGVLAAAAGEGVGLLTGGPGTGKSRTVAAVVRLCRALGLTVAVAAPTGRAAKRLSELLSEVGRDGDGGVGVPRRGSLAPKAATGPQATDENDGVVEPGEAVDPGDGAMTIHRLLGARLLPGDGEGRQRSVFDHDADNPIEADMVIIDEASMLDAPLAAALLAAIPDEAHVLLVGDPAQLPSIGPGRVLADILEARRYPATELTTLYRQSEGGAIARLAMAVRRGELIRPECPDHEVEIVTAADATQAADRVVQLVTDSIPRVFGTEIDQIQVITPMHRGVAGTEALNGALKKILNPGPHRGRSVRGFDVGDRVVATANHFDATPTGYANGEIGTVVDTGGTSLVVAFSGGEAEISGKALGELLHGWAITIHRAQGSEWEAVVTVLPGEARGMLSRPLVYTALTRARTHLSVVHAAGPALAHAVRSIGARPRRTRLAMLMA